MASALVTVRVNAWLAVPELFLRSGCAAGLARMDDVQPTPMMTIFELMVGLLPSGWRHVSDRSCYALDGAQPAVGQRGGEVLRLRLEVGDKGLQSDRAGRQREQRLHRRGRLVGEVVPLLDLETRGFDGRAQSIGRGQVTVFGPVGPGHREIGFAVLAGDDVPQSQPAVVG